MFGFAPIPGYIVLSRRAGGGRWGLGSPEYPPPHAQGYLSGGGTRKDLRPLTRTEKVSFFQDGGMAPGAGLPA